MPYKYCLFDLDGTLTDPKIGITRSFQYALAAFGINEDLENLVRFIGPPLRESFQQAYGFDDYKTERAVAKYREYYPVTGLYENTVYPDIPRLLQTLRDGGVIMAVATSKVTEYAQRILTHFELINYFLFVSGDTMDGSRTINGKCGLVLTALDALGCADKSDALMIGDRLHDIHGAREAGIDSAGVLWGYGSRAELTDAGATHIVNTADELLSVIYYGCDQILRSHPE